MNRKNNYLLSLESNMQSTPIMKKHILLVSEKRENSLPISLMLESYNFHVSLLKDGEDPQEKLEYFKSEDYPVDLIIFGTNFLDSQLNEFFESKKYSNKTLPFIIISDTKKISLMNHLLDLGFYGYLVNPADSVILIEQVNTIFFNIQKYKKNEKQNFISR